MRVGECRIEMLAVAMNALAHRALEGGIGPVADAGLDIGRDVGAVDDAERRLQRPPAGIDRAARAGVADHAIAERGELLAAGNGRGGKHRWIGPRNRRDRAPWQRRGADADRGRAHRGEPGEHAGPHGERILPFACGSRRLPATAAIAALPALRHATPCRMRSGVNGGSRSRTPVASKIALAIAAALGTDADSPTPSGGWSWRGSISTSILGTSGKVMMG